MWYHHAHSNGMISAIAIAHPFQQVFDTTTLMVAFLSASSLALIIASSLCLRPLQNFSAICSE
jgi:polysaccharide deacetylase 2 family uncharacterized protein YibQ